MLWRVSCSSACGCRSDGGGSRGGGGNSKFHPTGAATNDLCIGQDSGRGNGALRACLGRSGYVSSGGAASRKLHSNGCRGWRGRGYRVGGFFRERRGPGGGAVGTKRVGIPSAGAIAGIHSYSGLEGERAEGEEPLLSHKPITGGARQRTYWDSTWTQRI